MWTADDNELVAAPSGLHALVAISAEAETVAGTLS